MAKKQSFADKVKKKTVSESARTIKLVYPFQSPETGSWRYTEKYIKVYPEDDENTIIGDEIKSGRAALEKN